jgi:large subunit ribosomal protein L24
MASKAQATKLRIGDDIVVISGAHKGSAGTILRFNGDRSRVFVEGVNVVRRHEKPVPALGRPGGIREKEASIHISNVAYQTTDGGSRLGYKRLDDGNKVRVSKKTQEVI